MNQKKIKVLVENYGPDLAIWPMSRPQAQLVSWMVLHGGRIDTISGWRVRYTAKHGFQMWPFFILERFSSMLPNAWEKRLRKEQRFHATLPIGVIETSLGVKYAQALEAKAQAVMLPVTYTGELYIVGEGEDARQFLYRSQMDYVLAPQSILTPWDAILLWGWAWFYFDAEV